MIKNNDLEYKKLKKWNIRAGSLHFVSLIAVLILANNFALPVTATYMTGAPGTTTTGPIVLFSVRVALTIALFLGLSSFFHFLISINMFFTRYVKGLKNKRNIFRWVEYSLSSTLMIFVIAQLNGMSNYASLLAICGVNVSMILFGWLQEKYNTPGDGHWLPFIFGCIAGIIPWIIFAVQLITPKGPSSATAPGFVYGIVVSLFVLFNCFAVVQLLQYRAKGKWSNYIRGEKAYIILSFVAKSLLAWQIFAGALASK
ncbi:MAG: heliorhodopsin HeR [Candidatus Saccharibacteria bacterium]